jgi:hypothetical protein
MAEAAVPQVGHHLDGRTNLFIWGRLQWVETSFTPALKDCSPRRLFLYEKMIGLKFKEGIITFCYAMGRCKIFRCLRNMRYVFEN